ncbi:Lipopolysaccharide biosynthesis protein [Desulfonema limicola]|uniref:Lipopolysaccharide biosynthesis protein n=1 Tax=Desulfonema limicola TaxID=45656 RepID=A0A975B5J9_9BACT|nr:GumC family protein [Desulfonema limicola]QTA79177.1 Lipopolysaccharide biosynthesis protein [Desulfonema limicola]
MNNQNNEQIFPMEEFSRQADPGDQGLNLEDYYHIIIKHKWVIFAWFIIILSLTVFFTLKMTPIYQAAGKMVIENKSSVSPVTGENIDYSGGFINQQMAFNTHVKLIKSRPVLEKVIMEIGLDSMENQNLEENLSISPVKHFIDTIKKNIKLISGKHEQQEPPGDKMTAMVELLSKKISISPVRDTHLLDISVLDKDPVLAMDIANTLTRKYIEFDAAGRLKSSQDMMNWMTAQLYETKKILEDSEAEFQAYKQTEKIFSIEGKHQVITQQIQDFNDAYLEARNQRLELDSKMAELRRIYRQKMNHAGARLLVENTLIDNLYQQLLEAEVEFNRLSKIYKEMHPKIVQINGRIEKTQKKLDEELEKEMENLKAKRAVLLSKERVLQNTISEIENDALETNKKELQYTILERNVSTNRKLYDTLLTKIKASNVDENLDPSNIRIVETAALPQYPVKPNKKRNVLLGAVLGLMLGIGIAFLREYMDQSIRTEDDVQKYLNLPVLSVIPIAEKP